MENKLTAKIFDWFITTKCTMNCKLCAAAVPYVKKPKHTTKETAIRELHEFFAVWDYAERIEFIGGEPLLHPDICQLVKEALCYADRFDRLRITTNATIVPSDDLCHLIANCGKEFDFIIDDYGKLSKNLQPLVEKLDRYSIPYRIDKYHGEDQRFGGWIHFGNYTLLHGEAQANTIFDNCIAPKNAFCCVNNGKVFMCCYAMCLYLAKGLLFDDGSCIDLFSDECSIEAKKLTAMKFCTETIEACRYCNGFDAESGQRYPGPPEQLPRN